METGNFNSEKNCSGHMSTVVEGPETWPFETSKNCCWMEWKSWGIWKQVELSKLFGICWWQTLQYHSTSQIWIIMVLSQKTFLNDSDGCCWRILSVHMGQCWCTWKCEWLNSISVHNIWNQSCGRKVTCATPKANPSRFWCKNPIPVGWWWGLPWQS